MSTTDRKGRNMLLPEEALRHGWRSWGLLLALSIAGLIAVLFFASSSASAASPSQVGGASGDLAGSVLVGLSIAWLLLLGAAVLMLRSYCFRSLWDGRPVEPGSYLKGMYQVWGVLVAGLMLSVLGALLMGALLPGVLVGLVAFLLLIFSRPSGRALGV